jgi:hypothetical protein
MPIDPSIPYSVAQGFNTPFANLGAQVQTQRHQLDLEEERRKAERAKQVEAIWTHYGSSDITRALELSYEVDPETASKLDQTVSSARANWALEHGREIENEKKETARSAAMLQMAKGDPELYHMLVPYLAQRDPDFAAVASTFTGPDDPRIDAFLAGTGDVDKTLDRRQQYNIAFREGKMQLGAAGMLSTEPDPAKRAEMLKGFAPWLGPAQTASFAAMTPEQLAEAARTADQKADTATARRGQDIGSQDQRRGQDMSQATAFRGQNIGSADTRRGQDLAHQDRIRGQNLGVGEDGAKLTAGQQQELEKVMTVSDLATQIMTIGDESKWEGVGAGYQGTMGDVASQWGMGDPKAMSLRNKIANLYGAIAAMRAGLTLTEGEKKLLDRYTPDINDGDAKLRQKLVDLQTFAETKRQNMLRIAGGNVGAAPGAVTVQPPPKPGAAPVVTTSGAAPVSRYERYRRRSGGQ